MKLYAILYTAIAIAIVASTTTAAPLDQSDRSGSDVLTTADANTCRINGIPWGDDVDTAVTQMQKACTDWFVGKYIKGTNGAYKWVCAKLNDEGAKKHMLLGLHYIGKDESREIGQDECESGFSKEIKGCPGGGSRSYWNWQYSADTRTGGCNR
ncbi:hypothetical protein VPNG_07664 [Cytospora leucostoma]|uniref:Ecp2 effector protein domain-containing protein n=1 Tax=Cytospora leucostoma TaxID=1230097 RepID=A0A423WF35_9PEZI|nr:hypothetical protein VPNG_07664 [Cytospora leucostoma]